jgi:hypothetical protein
MMKQGTSPLLGRPLYWAIVRREYNRSQSQKRRHHQELGLLAGPRDMTIRQLHIFLSSPGDVSRERQLAREVIDRIESERA